MSSQHPRSDRHDEFFSLAATQEGARRLAEFAFLAEPDTELAEAPPLPGGYSPVRLLGEGGSGMVYLATHPDTQRLVAFKLFRHVGPDATGRAYREMEALADLRLPCVPVVQGFGQQEGKCYLATDYVEGQRLDEWCKDNSPNEQAKLEMLVAVSEAVQLVHDHTLLHRDLKPANIIVRPDGTPAIVDFGIARLLDRGPAAREREEGERAGTPAFMSPEQAKADQSQVTVRSDVYSLGAIGYWLIAGATPFDVDCDEIEAFRRLTHERPRHPAELSDDLSSDLSAALSRAVSVNQTERPASATEFAADLAAILRREPLRWTAPSLWRRSCYWLRTHQRAAAIVAVCALGYAVAALATSVAINRSALAAERTQVAYEKELVADELQSLVGERDTVIAAWQEWCDIELEQGMTDRERAHALVQLVEQVLSSTDRDDPAWREQMERFRSLRRRLQAATGEVDGEDEQ